MNCADLLGDLHEGCGSHVRRRAWAHAPRGPLLTEDYAGCQTGCAPWGRSSCTIRLTLTTNPVSTYWTCTRHWPRYRLRRPPWYRTISASLRSTRGCCWRTAV